MALPGILDGIDMRAVKALIFDCDGTLVDTAQIHLASLKAALSRMGFDIDAKWYLARTGLSPVGLLTEYEQEYQPLPVSYEDFGKLVNIAFQEKVESLKEVEIVASIAREYFGVLPMGVCSNGERLNVTGSLRIAGLLHLFDPVVTVEDVKRGKPAPDVYLRAAELMSIAPSACLVFEDSDEGLTAARTAGMRVVDVRPYVLQPD